MQAQIALRPQSAAQPAWKAALLRFLAVAGPGIVVAFADTEAGSITTAATSGAQFGMKLILLQALLIVPLFVVQEMTVRLGTATGKGHARLIREHYGLGWAWVSLGTMLVTNVAALVTEFAGIAGAAMIFGLNPTYLVLAAAAVLLAVIFSGAYKRAEIAALGLCLVELLFIPAAFSAHAQPMNVVREGLFGSQPLGNHMYLLLIASNIGAVIMPWMIFYQQSATVDKGLRPNDLPLARLDTAIGAVATQIIMIAIVVTTAATLYVRHIQVSDAAQAALALEPLVGRFAGVAFGAALIGASLLGAFVVSLATAWAFGEAFNWPCSLNNPCMKAKRFYGLYAGCVLLAAAFVVIPHLPLIQITIDVEAFNGFVLPIVLGFLLVMINDKRIVGERRNSFGANAVTMGLSAVIVVLGVWMAGTTLAGCAAQPPPALHGMQLSPPQPAKNFTLTDQNGKAFSLAQTRGQAVALYFGFTHCADVCPQTLALLGKARAQAKLTPKQARIVMVTVDPRRDSPAAFRAFFRRVGVDATGLGGNPAALQRAYRSYGIGVQPQKNDIAHTDTIFVIDPQGRIVETLAPQASVKDVAADLRSIVE